MKSLKLLLFLLMRHTSRTNGVNIVSCLLLLIAATVWLFAQPNQLQYNQKQVLILKQLEKRDSNGASRSAVTPKVENPMDSFMMALGDARYVEPEIKKLLQIAQKNGLNVQQMNYKEDILKLNNVRALRIELPLSGGYVAIRAFLEEFLLSTPFASLDYLHFKRELTSSSAVNAKLRLTLFLQSEAAGEQKLEAIQPRTVE